MFFEDEVKGILTLFISCEHPVCVFSTSGDVQYIRGCSVHQGMFITSGGVQYIGGYHEYIGGYREDIGGYREDIGGYHEDIGGTS